MRCLSDVQRVPGQYKTKADDYWSEGIRESHSKRPRLCNLEEAYEEEDLPTLSADELRSRLKNLGIKTRVRNVTSLIDMYLVGEAEVQKYMFTYHSEGQFHFMFYCTFRSNKYISAC